MPAETAITQLLNKYNADPSIRNSKNASPLQRLLKHNEPTEKIIRIALLMICKGADPTDTIDARGSTLLHRMAASQKNWSAEINKLVKKWPSLLDIKNEYKLTPLEYAERKKGAKQNIKVLEHLQRE